MMLKIDNTSELLGSYKDFKMAVLVQNIDSNEETIAINKSFKQLFLQKHTETELKHHFLKNFLLQINSHKQINISGCCYYIDKISEGNFNYYLFSPSSNSVMKSFLWLKHDLLNILNPIMGFSDILSESESMEPDDLELVNRILFNAKKMYSQIDRLSTLQNLNNPEKIILSEEYQISDFVDEMADILIINQHISFPSNILIDHNANVSARIANHDFRSVLESQILYFLSYQEIKKVDFKVYINDNIVHIQSEFIDCDIPPNYLTELILMEEFTKNCSHIDKLQAHGLNYLLLVQLVEKLDGKVSLDHGSQNILTMDLEFPITSHHDEIIDIKRNVQNSTGEIEPQCLYSGDVPMPYFSEFHKLFNEFDGLIILDEWENLANKIEDINTPLQDKEIKTIIEQIRKALRLFDIDMLKKIHHDCKSAFAKK